MAIDGEQRAVRRQVSVPAPQKIARFICTNRGMYLSKSQNVFVQIAKYICPVRNVWASMAIDGEQRAVRRQVSVPAPPLKRPSCQTGALDYHHLQPNTNKKIDQLYLSKKENCICTD